MSPEIVAMFIVGGVLQFAWGRVIGLSAGRREGIRIERLRNASILDAKQRQIDILEALIRSARKSREPGTSQAQAGWRSVLGFPASERVTRDSLNRAYHHLAKTRHPDRGGSTAAMAALNVARDAALKEVAA